MARAWAAGSPPTVPGGFQGPWCLPVEDAAEGYVPESKAATLAMVRAQGAIVGWTAGVEEVAAALG